MIVVGTVAVALAVTGTARLAADRVAVRVSASPFAKTKRAGAMRRTSVPETPAPTSTRAADSVQRESYA